MKNAIKTCILLFFSCTIISSCTEAEDSRVPPGYPFGDTHELNFTIFNECNSHGNNQQANLFPRVFDSENSALIRDRKTCDSMFGIISPGCNCSKINFDKFALACLNGYVSNVSEADFKPRVLINHKYQTFTIELRAHTKTYKGYQPFTYTYYDQYFTELLVVPKPPENYYIKTKYYYPAEEL